MKHKLTRRRFGYLMLAGTTATALGYFTQKTFAQTVSLDIIGVSPVAKANAVDEGIILQSFDLRLNQVKTMALPHGLNEAILEINEQLTSLTSFGNDDSTLVLSIAPVRTGNKENEPTRLVFLGTSPKTLSLSGLKKQNRLQSLLGANDGSLLGLVTTKNHKPPVDLVKINPSTGEISLIDKIKLPQTQRFSNLAQCPNGTIYTTALGRLGETSLVRLDLAQGTCITVAQLNYNGMVWKNGLSDLVCTKGDVLLALGAHKYETRNNLYYVKPSTGTMTLLTEYDVTRIALASG